MKRLGLGLLFCLWSGLALAQGCGPANPNCIVPTRPAGDSTNASASTAFVQQNALNGVSVLAFGAVCDGVTNDATAINSAIASAASGQTVYLPAGKACKVNTTINIGNGTASTASTVNGVILGCGSNPVSSSLFTALSLSSGCKLTWGGTTGNVISVNGPIQGWGLYGIAVDCLSQASSFGLNMQSALNGTIINTTWNNCARAHNGITVPQGGIFGDSNTENNNFYNTVITMPNIASSGVFLGGQVTDTTSNSHANNYYGLNIYMPLTATAFNPIVLQDSDSNRFYGVVIFGGGAGCVAVQYNYNDHNIWPASNGFYGIDPGTLNCATGFQNAGTPGASKSNYLYGLEEVNQATAPALANLAVFGSHDIVLATGGNTTPGRLSTDTAAHVGYKGTTPTLTAGCNGAGSSVTGNDNSGFVIGQTATATTCTLTFARTYAATPACAVNGNTAALVTVAETTATIVVTWTAATANFIWAYNCTSIN